MTSQTMVVQHIHVHIVEVKTAFLRERGPQHVERHALVADGRVGIGRVGDLDAVPLEVGPDRVQEDVPADREAREGPAARRP